MCGICGMLTFDGERQVDLDRISRMSDAIAHRGPDDSGFYLKGPCSLGHRRLSIIDIATGQQPMIDQEDGRVSVIVFNGEIYNYLDVKRELETLGHNFRTKSDTEVILTAYKQWGERCVEKLRGMFAFAVWDERERELFLARDRMGEKPLYYYSGENFFLFASEIKALLASGLLKAELELLAVDSFLTLGYVPAPQTMFKQIFKLLPGYSLSIGMNGEPRTRCYWNFKAIEEKAPSFPQAVDELEQLLTESVKMRLMSEVPLGVFLSGGLDSSSVVALMSKVTNQKIKTFSVGFSESEGTSELEFARKVADKFETEHHEFTLNSQDFFDFIPKLVSISEEPLVETAAIPLYEISKIAKEFATVLLSGEGGDEVFAGYSLYKRMLSLEKAGMLRGAAKLVPNALVPGDKYKKYLDWVSKPLSRRYRGTSADLTDRSKKEFYSPDFLDYSRSTNYTERVFLTYFDDVAKQSPLQQMQYVDSKTWLADDLLLKADKMTMACAIELRVPFLDHEVVEYGARLPMTYKINGGSGKHILKKLMERYLPMDIVHRPKMGFSMPTRKWFESNLITQARETLLSDTILNTGLFRKKYIESILHRHKTGKEDYSRRIFSLVVLFHWFNQFINK
jgi:asparagine synthase (glutamine-hydrolysing)